ncbi:50S ribosomal protein L11 methyltransferase [Pediococcus argentinicus]|uniref:Ribosomal protein L11 methyltransferase n=1 Tax=Pediococcus argentinicus TaxID=480391 RepID=A0A0R2NKJ1_9LACO|nr:50S ribosomal protein L11 methyltransferase [Pediococcus argentinicus]KRO26244.1 prmA protein [Pediococcus argentinicus]NKZ21564.1 50S ribosomal protein L11 methyltransferase [Pediococcus argentinicus]GEP18637.1 ribosomal protein L11 methyltransferase [Pediococcus argentinicus]
MKWTEVNVNTTNEAVEAVSSMFEELGAIGVKIDDALDYENYQTTGFGELYELKDIPHITEGAMVSAYYPETTDLKPILTTLKSKLDQLSSFGIDAGKNEITTLAVKDDDWATAWKKYYHPVRITRYLTVTPSWDEYKPTQESEHVIRLDPGMAFGTGTHPTTRLCLQGLEMVVRGGESMYDVGTGSGVLSIAAKHLGVGDIEAFDLDDIAVKAAEENLDLNPIAKDIKVSANNLLENKTKKVDLIVANILADIIVPLVPQAAQLLNENGYFITSGIIDDKLPVVLAALEKEHFKIEEILQFGEWRGVIATNRVDD